MGAGEKMTSIMASFREKVAVIVFFYTPSAKTTKAILDDFAGELSQGEYKALNSKVKSQTLAHLVFSLRHPFGFVLSGRIKVEAASFGGSFA